jgi:uncharacterized protein
MTADRFIDAGMAQRIQSELTAIEERDNVRILLAIESGSRAWRFPSTDSDYDVRFLYIRSLEQYLAIEPVRDVIERPLEGDLDIGGWDLRKALQLMCRSNAVLIEWLTSPVRYRASDKVADRLLELASTHSDPVALSHHYDRLARTSFSEITTAEGPVRFKTYCYALRSAMALLWIRQFCQPPPMDLPRLMAGLSAAKAFHQTIEDLIARKANATESDRCTRIPLLDEFLADCLKPAVERPPSSCRPEALADANAFFARILLVEGEGA